MPLPLIELDGDRARRRRIGDGVGQPGHRRPHEVLRRRRVLGEERRGSCRARRTSRARRTRSGRTGRSRCRPARAGPVRCSCSRGTRRSTGSRCGPCGSNPSSGTVVEVGALDQADPGEHRRDRRRQLALHADRGAAEVLEGRGLARLHDQPVDRGAAFDRDGDEVGLVGDGERDDLAERAARRELRVVGGDQRVVGGREAGLDLDVEAQLVEVAAFLGDQDLDDGGRGGEVEARQVGDGAGGPVGLAPFVGERFCRSRRRGRRCRCRPLLESSPQAVTASASPASVTTARAEIGRWCRDTVMLLDVAMCGWFRWICQRTTDRSGSKKVRPGREHRATGDATDHRRQRCDTCHPSRTRSSSVTSVSRPPRAPRCTGSPPTAGCRC